MVSIRIQAKRAMNTRGQKACMIIDHLVEALAGDPSAFLRRALILSIIDENKGITQTEIMQRITITKSAMNREIEWLFNYGCIKREGDDRDGRAIRLKTCGYAKRALQKALDYFPQGHSDLHDFLTLFTKVSKQDRATLRDARIIATLYDKGNITKTQIIDSLYNGPATTDNRAYKKLVKDGVIHDNV